MQKISTFLWFEDQAEEAVKFYTSIFKNSSVGTILRYSDEGPGPKGSVMTATFYLNGHEFTAINGGPQYHFTPAISFMIHCKTQDEIDYYWSHLTEGGQEEMCGWLRDKFGVSWQVVPEVLLKMLNDPNPEKARSVTQAMFQMRKIDLARLQQAYI